MKKDDANGNDEAKQFAIKIDRENFKVDGPAITGAELRRLPNPPIGSDRDLFLTIPGPDPDPLIGETDAIELKNGMHFFTAPASITPGGNALRD
jgi:Multiubiquitin